MDQHNITIYTDGSCIGNPGPGGWAALLICGEHEKVVTGNDKDTTNNRMELTAVIEGLADGRREACYEYGSLAGVGEANG